jgi:hypothetical protein
MSDPAVARKLQIKPGFRLLAVNPPGKYAQIVGGLPDGASVTGDAADADVVHLFVTNRADLAAHLPRIAELVTPDAILWISYPKRGRGIDMDLTRDTGWEPLREAGFDPVSQVAIDDTWSALRFRRDPALRAARAARGVKGYRTANKA